MNIRRLIGLLAAIAGFAGPVRAVTPAPAPPVRQQVDANGVDLVNRTFNTSATDVSIGPAGLHGLAYNRYYSGAGWRDSLSGTITGSTSHPVVSIGGQSISFTLSGGSYVSDQANGATFVVNPYTSYVVTLADGTVGRFEPSAGTYDRVYANLGWLTSLTFPDGTAWSLNYKTKTYCLVRPEDAPCTTALSVRLQSVTSSLGYQLKLAYASNTLNYQSDVGAWNQLTRVTAINNAVEYCDPTADSCALTGAWPYASYGYTNGQLTSVTDPNGKVWRYSYGTYGLTGLRRPTSSSDDVVVAYSGSTVLSVAKGGGTWTYGSSTSGTTQTTTVGDPLSHMRTVVADTTTSLIGTDTNENGYTTSYHHDAAGRIDKVTLPEGNYATYAYDTRGNVTTLTQVAKSGSGLANIVTSASYPATCSNLKTCNQPTSTTDARGNVTDYAYDAGSGLVTSVTSPAPAAGGVRPQTRYGYVPLYAWIKTSSGSYALGPSLTTFQLTTSQCRTSASCARGADEIKGFITYLGGGTSTGTNVIPLSVSISSGDGALSSTTGFTFDNIGNRTSVTDPLGNVTKSFYDARRQPVAVLSPDPDGGGPKRSREVVIHYSDNGQPDSYSAGTGNPDLSGFTPLQITVAGYDNLGRKTSDLLYDGGLTTAYSLTQYGYDAVGRLQCTTQRMNPAAFSTLAAPCTLGTQGSFGPDRISYNVYEYAGLLAWTYTGYGTALQRREVYYLHNYNGVTTWLTDAKGNVTGYARDGFDRLSKTSYPSPTSPGSVSATDYEQLAYDASSNVTQRRLRDGQLIGYAYDNLDRLSYKDLPAPDYDASYAYDLQGRPTAISQGPIGQAFFYDGLGRLSLEGGQYGTASSQYNLAGRRTRLTWDDGFYVTYDYYPTGEMFAVREYGAQTGPGVLAAYYYDDLGRRTSIVRGNGTVTSYGYDGASRLTSLSHDLAGTAWDMTYTLANYSPAGEIGSRTASNDGYAWHGAVNVARAYATNGLNQYTASGSVVPSYDLRGNLTIAGGAAYAYSSENLLKTASGGVSLFYDPLGRLAEYDTTVSARFVYDGAQMIQQVVNPSGATTRRYVWGAAPGELLAWYEGSGTADRRYAHADERGSIVGYTDASGTAIIINHYDEYGIPESTNNGQFQYTGQMWLPELGLYDYKARMYSATLGRFLQTDPIGYGDGTNWYNYVGSDPVNRSDPSGLSGGNGGASDIPQQQPIDGYTPPPFDPNATLTGTRIPGGVPAGLFAYTGGGGFEAVAYANYGQLGLDAARYVEARGRALVTVESASGSPQNGNGFQLVNNTTLSNPSLPNGWGVLGTYEVSNDLLASIPVVNVSNLTSVRFETVASSWSAGSDDAYRGIVSPIGNFTATFFGSSIWGNLGAATVTTSYPGISWSPVINVPSGARTMNLIPNDTTLPGTFARVFGR